MRAARRSCRQFSAECPIACAGPEPGFPSGRDRLRRVCGARGRLFRASGAAHDLRRRIRQTNSRDGELAVPGTRMDPTPVILAGTCSGNVGWIISGFSRIRIRRVAYCRGAGLQASAGATRACLLPHSLITPHSPSSGWARACARRAARTERSGRRCCRRLPSLRPRATCLSISAVPARRPRPAELQKFRNLAVLTCRAGEPSAYPVIMTWGYAGGRYV